MIPPLQYNSTPASVSAFNKSPPDLFSIETLVSLLSLILPLRASKIVWVLPSWYCSKSVPVPSVILSPSLIVNPSDIRVPVIVAPVFDVINFSLPSK